MTKDTNKTPPEKLSKKSSKNPAKTAAVLRDQGVDENENKQGVVAFSIDDVKALIESRTNTKKTETLKKKKAAAAEKKVEVKEEPVEKRVLGAASLSDILGFNPAKKETSASMEESSVPPKWKKYYKLLVELREELSEEISLHTSETLQHRSDDHAGDRTLEDDAGTDAFDRDFALSLVSNEQDALNEIEEALFRIKKGTYGVCEVTGKPISKERLTAVPFTRFSVEGQVEFEKNMRRKVDRNTDGLFADSTDSDKIVSGDDDDE